MDITLKLTLAEINILVGALGKQSLESGVDLFLKIRKQVEEQTAQAKAIPSADGEEILHADPTN